MIQYDRDAVAAIDIPAAEKAVADGQGRRAQRRADSRPGEPPAC